MSRGYRMQAGPFRGLVCAVVFGSLVPLHGQAQKPSAEDHPAYGDHQIEAEPPGTSVEPKVPKRVRPRSRGGDPSDPTPDNTHWFWRDPAAQWLMALASFYALYLLGRTLQETKNTVIEAQRSADAAENTVKVTQKASENQLRAYLAPTPHVTEESSGDMRPYCSVEIKNCGSTPAYNVWGYIDGFLAYGTREEIETEVDQWEISESLSHKGIVYPGMTINVNAFLGSPLDANTRKDVASGCAWMCFFGRLVYKDAFNNPRYLTFRYLFGGTSALNKTVDIAERGNDAN